MKSKEYLKLAIPFTISTITQPLLGAVDTAVIGRLEDPAYIGGVAVGTVIFSTLYWLFGFLRVSTSGYSAQALGTKDEKDSLFALFRPGIIALIVSAIFLMLQVTIISTAMKLIHPDAAVARQASTYFYILIWGAPFVLLNYVNLGWLMGRKKVKASMFLQIFTNILNIVLDILFVIYFKMGVAGVAYATLIAQATAFAIGFYLVSMNLNLLSVKNYLTQLFDKTAFKKIMGVNTDLMIRTVCLLVVTNMFVAKGAALGTEMLAANAVLFQIHYMIAYFFDGFANASSVFVGTAVGEKNVKLYSEVLKISTKMTFILAVVMSLGIFFFREGIIHIFTVIESVIDLSLAYSLWLVIYPFAVGIGLVYYGLFTGATYTAPVRDSMLLSLAAFLMAYFGIVPLWGNHGLWFSYILFSLGRSIFLAFYITNFKKKVFAFKGEQAICV
ncbi:MATE family efflux transporter [Geosporobacter ferrireducens]|uniref:Probable multidrug resistance protein NorM n=1 Tax=Geosporobacter ferrireducens TaxID=1424294 RepID=A0A1D8GF60_9FIRM|nr:MATE family efflux transporter [Geosporobacter ferrireducens]AOT69542.1 MATE family efflux transporter [Geosporobacter ferrireducens]